MEASISQLQEKVRKKYAYHAIALALQLLLIPRWSFQPIEF